MPAFAMNCTSSANSARVPMVEPWTRSCRKKIRFSSADFGAWPLVVGTLVTAAIALVIGVPIAVATALFITELAPRRVRQPLVILVELLAAVPSVVYGLWGIGVLAPALQPVFVWLTEHLGFIPLFAGPASGTGRTILTVAVVLAVMILPIVTALSREVFLQVPRLHEEAALALGATRWEMIRAAVFSHSKGGMVGAVTLGLGRAMGETIAAALVIGSNPQISAKLFGPGYSMPSVIANEFGESAGLWRAALVGLGVTLFVITILINLAARGLVNRSIRKSRGLA